MNGNPSLARVDSIVFLQGAHEGSWLGKADQVANQALVSRIPGVRGAVTSLEQLALDQFQIDKSRPAITDLTPQSSLYLFDSKAQYLPSIRYANVASDITTRVATRVWWWTVTVDLPVRLGDYVFTSVVVPWDLSTSEPVVGEDAQTDQCFDNMRIVMEEAGGTIDDVVLQWVYLNDFAYQPYMVDV